MDRLGRAFAEFQSAWTAVRDERDDRGRLDANVAWMGDDVDAGLERIVVSLEAFGIDLSAHLVEDSVPVGDVFPGDGDRVADRIQRHSAECGPASEVLQSICSLRDAHSEVRAVFEKHERLAVLHLRHLHREASRKRLYFYVDFDLFVKLVQQDPVTDLDLVWHRQKFAEWVLIMPSSGHRGSGEELRVTMEVPGLFVQ